MLITATPEEARAIAKDAYLYGWPISENYNTINAGFIDTSSPHYRAPFNELYHSAKVSTPDDTLVVTPNSDTPYSVMTADLRAEPLVLSVPAMTPAERYFSFQLIDAYTHNFGYIGTRATGDGPGTFLLAGPSWEGGDTSKFDGVLYSETELVYIIGRTQLFNADDLPNVQAIQRQYQAQPLSQFLGTTAPPAPPCVDWPSPLFGDPGKTPAVFGNINCMLQFCPIHPTEVGLMRRFARIGVGPGLPFERHLKPIMRAAIQAGIGDAWAEFSRLGSQMATTGKPGSGDLFGTRDHLNNNYLYRFAGAKLGLYGNSAAEAIYPNYSVDADGNTLDAAAGAKYTLTLNELPPAKAFWSITMYDKETQLLVHNPIDRYLVNSPMLDMFVRGDNGAITFYIQKDAPEAALQPNWLPAPDGPFYMVMRLYIPEQSVLDGTWTAPPVERVK